MWQGKLENKGKKREWVGGWGNRRGKGRRGDKQIDEQTRIVDGGEISDKIFTSSWLLWQIEIEMYEGEYCQAAAQWKKRVQLIA